MAETTQSLTKSIRYSKQISLLTIPRMDDPEALPHTPQ
jgi:hypothetical protein